MVFNGQMESLMGLHVLTANQISPLLLFAVLYVLVLLVDLSRSVLTLHYALRPEAQSPLLYHMFFHRWVTSLLLRFF